ncbi:helix-turn-helix domain-containing protein [Nocardia sp. NBC_00508]|uniref:helix-turn-helix domain-containing protein n=1 Tax=Nocardia sp. NBC_00508 TaxID=2975992 RepID=UPI002E81988A|nr:helix-turn-helix domain-containing protein [Nocardia sp. NBC_00508]WUD65296.1 helix-turn-helix domain-containing protein [Nocardia sp. NBC_00508]
MAIESRYVDVEGAAAYLGTGVRFIRRLVAERRVVFYKVGGHVRFKVSDLEAYAQAGKVEPIEVRWSGGKAVA